MLDHALSKAVTDHKQPTKSFVTFMCINKREKRKSVLKSSVWFGFQFFWKSLSWIHPDVLLCIAILPAAWCSDRQFSLTSHPTLQCVAVLPGPALFPGLWLFLLNLQGLSVSWFWLCEIVWPSHYIEVLALRGQRLVPRQYHSFSVVVKPGKRVPEDKANTFCPCVWSGKETGELEARNGIVRDKN